MYNRMVVVITVVVYLVTLSLSAADLNTYRLPSHIVPHHYNLSISTDLEGFVFSGQVDIEIECKTATDVFKIHTKLLEIADNSVVLTGVSNNKTETLSGISFDIDNDFLIIQVKEQLVQGLLYVLHIDFRGNLTDSMSGYYRSSYKDRTSNSTKWLAVTQFESTDARKAFPCFDEPAMKASFRIQLGHKAHLKSISNMPLLNSVEDEERPDWVWDQFQETVPMSTYLVAFMVSDFEYRESKPQLNNVLFRVWARKDAIEQVEFARNNGPKFLNYYEDFFGISFPLAKQDMAAIPDFDAEAMENWGLITYEESLLLVDENSTSMEAKYWVATTVAHELAHQWFGNLVTMKWWTDLWLNEGLTTYITSLAVQNQFPEWNSFNFDIAKNLFDTLSMDALTTSHPVSVPIKHPDEVDQMFDAISYSKGSLLVHMMSCFLGNNVFRTGINQYLKRFEYQNSEQDDLWESLTAEADKSSVLPNNISVKDIMDTWTLQTGYPLVSVRREGGKITISQKRFLAVQPIPEEEPEGCWWIPLTYSTGSNVNFNETRSTQWLNCNMTELTIDTRAEPSDWIILNNKAAGLYRVNYDPFTWSKIADALHGPNFTVIHELNRLQLVFDAMALARVAQLDYAVAFRVLRYIKKETAFNPWRAATTSLQDLVPFLWDSDKFEQFRSLVASLLSDMYERFNAAAFIPKGFEDNQLKALIMKWACNYHVADCTQNANELFKAWMTNGIEIPKDLREAVYCEGIRQGRIREWNYVWNQYLASNVASERNTFLKALACTTSASRILKYMDLSFNSSLVRKQDAVTLFSHVIQTSNMGFRFGQIFLNHEIQRLHDYFAPDTEVLGVYFITLARHSVLDYQVQELKNLFTNHKTLFAKSELGVSQGLEAAQSNLQWMKLFYNNISDAMAV